MDSSSTNHAYRYVFISLQWNVAVQKVSNTREQSWLMREAVVR